MTTNPIIGKTPKYGFNLISFDFPRWGTFEQENWRLVDALLDAAGVVNSGIWRNGTVYAAGSRVVDSITQQAYAAQVTHTSAASGTFADDRTANPSYWVTTINAPLWRGDWAPTTAYSYLDVIRNPADNAYYICTIAHTSGGTFNGAFWVQTSAALDWASINGKPDIAQCRLEYNAGSLVLMPKDGDRITIDGIERVIPAAGVSLSAAGVIASQATTNRAIAGNIATLTFASNTIPVGAKIGVKGLGGTNQAGYQGTYTVTASTGTTIQYASSVATDASAADVTGVVYPIYYIYAGADGSGNVTLEASLTGHSLDPARKIRTKTGDTTKRLVGMAAAGTGPAWVESTTQKLVRSYYNRRRRAAKAVGTIDRNYTATTQGEIHAEYRTEFLIWSDEVVDINMCGSASSAGNASFVYISVDSISAGESIYTIAGSTGPIGLSANIEGLVEGYHVAAPLGKAIAGATLTVYSSAANGFSQLTSCTGG